MYSLLHLKASFYSAVHKSTHTCPVSSSFDCEQKYCGHKLIATYLTKQSPRHYLYFTKEESGTPRAK